MSRRGIHNGDGTDLCAWNRPASGTPMLAAVTGNDEASTLVATSLARFEFNMRTIARVSTTRATSGCSTPKWAGCGHQSDRPRAKLIVEEMSLGDMVTLLKLRKGDELVEEKIAESAIVNARRSATLPGRRTQ